MGAEQTTLDFMEQARAGDPRALEELYDRFTPLLYSLALRIVGTAADAEDVIQQTWTQAWKSIRRYDEARGSVATWLINIARSRALDQKRSSVARERREQASSPVDPRGDPVASLSDKQRHERVRHALEALPVDQRRVLELAYFEGLVQSEIAERLDKPLGTVKSWTRRALLQLREQLAGEEESA